MIIRKIQISDMQCEGCAGRVRKVLMELGGVVKVIISLDDHSAEVTFDEATVKDEDLSKALRSAGFGTTGEKCC
ncbi:MAG: heavy-metal-associated domain-containing protein [Planctomycetes bacterium]|nr:heavy-metal-associated domain-containing protein [Planctomycetota bacterium]